MGARRTALLTHSLVEMVQTARRHAPTLDGRLPDARELDLHSIPSRSPNGLPSGYPHAFYGRDPAERALGAPERIVGSVAEHYRARGERDLLREPSDAEL